jgi:hypothetical protein
MTIRWTQPANDDFLDIVGWIAASNPAAAAPVGPRRWDVVNRPPHRLTGKLMPFEPAGVARTDDS